MVANRETPEDQRKRAELNRNIQDVQDLTRSKLIQLAEKSLDVIEHTLDNHDAKTALIILKGLGYLDGKYIEAGASNAEELKYEKEIEEKRKIQNRMIDSLMYTT